MPDFTEILNELDDIMGTATETVATDTPHETPKPKDFDAVPTHFKMPCQMSREELIDVLGQKTKMCESLETQFFECIQKAYKILFSGMHSEEKCDTLQHDMSDYHKNLTSYFQDKADFKMRSEKFWEKFYLKGKEQDAPEN